MKIKYLLVVLMFIAAAPFSRAQFGIEAGLTYNELSDVNAGNVEQSFDAAQGKHVGVFYILGKRNLGVRLGVRYMDAEGLYKDVSQQNADGFKASFVEVPVDLRLRLNTPILKPYVVGGVLGRVASGSDDEAFQDAMQSWNLAANVGAGLELRLGGLSFYPELNYTVGLNSIMKEGTTVGGVTFNADDSKLNQFVIKVGIGFH